MSYFPDQESYPAYGQTQPLTPDEINQVNDFVNTTNQQEAEANKKEMEQIQQQEKKDHSFSSYIHKPESWCILLVVLFIAIACVMHLKIKRMGRDQMKKYDRWIVMTLVGLVIITGSFYWFQLRPSEATKQCNKDWTNYSAKVNGPNSPYRYDALKDKYGEFDGRNDFMSNCLAFKGIK